jgi:uncharacterized protein (TIGR02145 family)
MRYSIFIMLVVLGWVCLGQSKKEQIRVLTNRLDSLNFVLNSERTDYSQRVEQLNGRISELEEKVRGLEIKLKEKDSENEIYKKQIEELRKLINVKSDSLMVLKAEVDKLKPTPKPVVQNKPVDVTPSGPYKTVTIGTQVWMKENLNVSTFRNGDSIPEAKTEKEWIAAGYNEQPAWCYYNYDHVNGTKYGKLYNWCAVNDARGVAPSGYHVPTDVEWTVLADFLGGESVAGGKMKSTIGWDNYKTGGSKTCPNCFSWNSEYRKKTACHKCKDTRYVPAPEVTHSGNGVNSSGFSGLPGGHNMDDFAGEGFFGFWWSSSEYKHGYYAWYRQLTASYGSLGRNWQPKKEGCSVRCLKD